VTCVQGLESLYDIVNMHTYAMAEEYPTWRRSYPEDPNIPYLKDVRAMMDWRDAHAKGKALWVTEFGWDASTKPAPKTGDFSKWVGSTETQQAQYLVRSFLVFAEMGVDRAYLFWFNDQDEPQLHGSSGITRNYQPKPAFYAVAHLYRTLGEYRFSRVVTKRTGDLYVYEFAHGTDPKARVWAVWSPTGSGREAAVSLPAPPGTIQKAERMPLREGAAEAVPWQSSAGNTLRLMVGESPVYLWFRMP
jgi:serine/threonine-protein kinase ATR